MDLQSINFFTTYRCNSRCVNCFIWKNKNRQPSRRTLNRNQLNRLFTDPLIERCSNVGLAGGEPTISPFFWDLLEIIPKDKFITVSTNALNSSKLIRFLSQFKHKEKISIQVSIDGIGEVNDRIRGVSGAFRKTTAFLKQLQELNINFQISFTINKLNYFQLFECYELAGSYNAQFVARMVQIGGAYENKNNRSINKLDNKELAKLEALIDKVIFSEIDKPSPKIDRIIFYNNIIPYAKGKKIVIECYALQSSIVIDLYGEVFPACPNLMTSVGNVKEQSVSDIINSKKAKALNHLIKSNKYVGCWNDCQMITNIALNESFKIEEYKKTILKWLNRINTPELLDTYSSGFSLMVRGLYPTELEKKEGFCWTKPIFFICLPKGTKTIKLTAMLPKKDPKIESGILEITLNEITIDKLILLESVWQEYTISLKEPVDQLEILKCRLNRYYSPFEENSGPDQRKLGLAINKIEFSKT